MSTGQGFGYSLFGNSIKSNDVTAINNYANALKNGASVGEAWRTTMNGTSVAAKQYVLNARKAGKSTAELTQGLNNMTLGAKASTVAMKALGVAKNVALNVGTMLLISGVMKVIGKISEEIDDFIHRTEIAREKSTELTRAWNEENTSIGSSISKYKELKESLDSGTLSTQEIANAKNELAQIQDTLTSKYGQEALGIDLVNGKYDEQIKKLDELSRKKAEDYTAENYANIQEDIKYVNNSVKVDEELGSGAVFNPDTYNKYLKKYLDEYDALTTRVTDRNGIVGSSGLNIVGEGTREEIYNQLTSLFNDLSRDFGEDNPDVNKLKTALSGIISDSFDTEKMEQAKSNIKQYAEAQILSQNNTRQLYEDAINAVDNYNKALASGQGVEEAKANLDEVKQKVADNTSGISGAGQVFEDVWGEISEGAKTTSENVNKMTVSLSEMEKASDKISKLGSAFKELTDDGYITTKTLGEIQVATGLSGDEWAVYENKLLNAKKGSSEFNQVMSELTYKILDQTFAGKDLTDVTEDQIAAVLRENGVVNADAIAQDYLLRAKSRLAIATGEVTASTTGEIISLASEAQQAGLTAQQIFDLVIKEGILNNTRLNLSQQIATLQELGFFANWAAGEIQRINQVKAFSASGKQGVATYDENGNLTGVSLLGDFNVPKAPTPVIPNYSGNSSKNKSGGGSDKTPFDDTYYSAINAWLEENEKEIEKFEEERESLNRKFENTLDIGNKEQAEILRTKLSENAKTQKDILHRQNEAHRITKNDLLTSLYKIAPELNGKAWEDISEVDLIKIENSLNHTAEMASDDNAKNQAKLTSNRFKGIIEDLRAIDEAIKANSDSWLEEDDNARGYWESLIDFQDSYSNEWIENQKAYDNLTEQEELNAYSRMINNYKEFQRQILADMSLSEDAKLALIKKSNELIDDYSEKHYQLQKEASWNNSNNWINDRNTYNDWALFNDSEVEAWERVLLRIRSEYPKDLEKIREAEKNLFEARKKELDKANDFSSSYLESQKTLLQAQYDVENSLAEARHEINKELETSMTMYGYLEEDTRKLLFNQEDYNTLVKELNGIENKASRLQDEYDRKLRNSTLETVESITSEYQMQYETLMKSYEIAKADLEIAKKKQKLNNVLNERNVRMFINGSWQWVANTEDVANAKAELADAEYAKQVEQAGLTQKNSIDALTKKQDALGLTIKLFEGGVIDLKEAVRLAKDAIGDMPFALYDAYSKMGSSLSSSGSRGSSGSSSSGSSSSASNATAWIPGLGNVGVTIGSDGRTKNSGLPVGTIVHTGGGDYKITGSSGGNYTSEPVKKKLASGSRYTSGGMTLMGEEGFEAYITSEGRLIPIAQPTIGNIPSGGVVFNKDQLSGLRTLWDMSNLKFNTDRGYIGSAQPQQVDQSQDNRIIINGMTVDSGSSDGQALISALRRYVGNH